MASIEPKNKQVKDPAQNQGVASCKSPHVDLHAKRNSLHTSGKLTYLGSQLEKAQDI